MIRKGWKIVEVTFPEIGPVMIAFKGNTIRIRKYDDERQFISTDHNITKDLEDKVIIHEENWEYYG